MNTIPAQEIKRRGVKAIELALKNGPVHILKNNQPSCVVITEEDYAQLTRPSQDKKAAITELLQWMLEKPATGNKTRQEIDSALSTSRDEWAR